jgi:hypothetical protein
MIYIILFLTSVITPISCKYDTADKQEKPSEITGEIDGAETEDFTEIPVFSKCTNYNNNLSSIASKVDFIPLEAEPPIRDFHVYDVSANDRYLFLSNIYQIIMYDRQGKYIRHIGHRGQGPEEFIQLDITLNIDFERKLIYASDVRRNRIIVYRFDGSTLKIIPLYTNISHINIIDSDSTRMVGLQTSSDRFLPACPLIRFIDSKGKHVKTYPSHYYPLERDKVELFGPDCSFFWKHGEKSYYLEYATDTVFQVLKDTIVPVRRLTGELKPDIREHFRKYTGRKTRIMSYVMRSNAAIFESDGFMIFKLSDSRQSFYKIYDKKSCRFHRTFHGNVTEDREGHRRMEFFIDDLVSGLPFNPQYQNNGKVFALIPATDICDKRKEILDFIHAHPTEEGAKLKHTIENMNENDNAVVMAVTLK